MTVKASGSREMSVTSGKYYYFILFQLFFSRLTCFVVRGRCVVIFRISLFFVKGRCADSYYYCNCALARANALRGMCVHIKRFIIYV